ncbi:MAG: hypothetical protein ACI9FZ_001021 [Bacteroidia bacterium]|jgi:hypothetical protein
MWMKRWQTDKKGVNCLKSISNHFSVQCIKIGNTPLGDCSANNFDRRIRLEAYNANNLPLAYTEFRAAANEGHLDSQFNVARMYENGIEVEKDLKAALAWYRKASLKGSSGAQFNLGVLYEGGRGTEVNFAEANEWYRQAAVQGDPLAMGNLGMLYIRGDGVPVNKVSGIALLLQSATLDSSPANNAKQNISGTQGLTPQIIQEAQALVDQMGKAKNLLLPLDQHLT